jgi:putative membrane protein
MKINQTLLAMLCGFLVTGLNTGCQRNDNGVQAAREEKTVPAGTDNMAGKNVLTPQDQDIVRKIEQANQSEIDEGRLAQTKASNPEVKSFADTLVQDHTAALNDLMKLMRDMNAEVSPQENAATAGQQPSEMQNLQGAAFDRAFIDKEVTGHEKTLEELRSFEGSAQNPDLKNYISNLIPTIQKHLDEAQDLQNKMMKTGTQ